MRRRHPCLVPREESPAISLPAEIMTKPLHIPSIFAWICILSHLSLSAKAEVAAEAAAVAAAGIHVGGDGEPACAGTRSKPGCRLTNKIWSSKDKDVGGDGGNGRALDGDIDRPCSLICLNGGSCQLSTDAEVAQLGHPSQYCACPTGYGGITCIACSRQNSDPPSEYIAEQCGFYESGIADLSSEIHEDEPHADGVSDADVNGADAATQQQVDAELIAEEKYCLHGAPCKVTVDSATQKQIHTCDCSQAIEAGAYAGEACQHKATSYCREGKVQRQSFCVNGGTCRAENSGTDGHAGCDCPSAFEGDFCEYEKGLNMTHRYEVMQRPKSEVASIVLGSVLIAILASVVMATLYVSFDGCRERRKNRTTAALKASTADLALDPDGDTLKGATAASAEAAEREEGGAQTKDDDPSEVEFA